MVNTACPKLPTTCFDQVSTCPGVSTVCPDGTGTQTVCPISVTYCPVRAKVDVNCDGRVNILDLLAIRQKLGQPEVGEEEREDVNDDFKINILDLIEVRDAMNPTPPIPQP
ncbi:MAG TPA: dockerin type I domain-containing protein [Planctomycetota bacterium]|nr:dockerin type I domain-containing protein [Planctomycetota bacterium]